MPEMDHVRGELSALLDGELAAHDRRRVESHLDGCSQCRGELEDIRSVTRMVAQLPRRPLPTGFMERLERRRRQVPEPEPVMAWFGGLTPARLAAVAVCGVAVVLVVREGAKRGVVDPMLPSRGGHLASMESPSLEAAPAGGAGPSAAPASNLTPILRSAADPARKSELAFAGGRLVRGSAARPEIRARGRALIEEKESPPASEHTNESIQQFLRQEHDRMGIRDIVARGRQEPADAEARRGAQVGLSMDESRASMRYLARQIEMAVEARRRPTVPIGAGSKPKLLSAPEDSNPSPGEPLMARRGGSLSQKASFSQPLPLASGRSPTDLGGGASPRDGSAAGAGAGGMGPAPSDAPQREPAEEAPAAPPPEPGDAGGSPAGTSLAPQPVTAVLRRAAELDLYMKGPGEGARLPPCDFSKEMLVVLSVRNAPAGFDVEIVSVTESDGRLIVRFREKQSAAASGGPVPLIYQSRVVARSEKPVLFQKVP